MKKNKIYTDHCNYHLCKKKTKLYKCKYCGRYYCKEHLSPKLVLLKSFIDSIKDRVLKDKLYDEWRRKDGHPCTPWTAKFWEELRNREETEKISLKKLLDNVLSKTIEENSKEAIPQLNTLFSSGENSEKMKSLPEENKVKEKTEDSLILNDMYKKEKTDKIQRIKERKKKNFSKFIKYLIEIGVIAVIILLIVFFANNLSRSIEKNFLSLPETNFTTLCLNKFEQYVQNQRTKFHTNFMYKIIETREFKQKTDAERWVEETYPFITSSKICEDSKKRLISIIYKIELEKAILGIREFVDVFYCDEEGRELRKCDNIS